MLETLCCKTYVGKRVCDNTKKNLQKRRYCHLRKSYKQMIKCIKVMHETVVTRHISFVSDTKTRRAVKAFHFDFSIL